MRGTGGKSYRTIHRNSTSGDQHKANPQWLVLVAFCLLGDRMSLWNGKKYVKVLQPTNDCRLGLSEVLIYSYLAYQDAFDTSPGVMQIVRGIGLSKNTVAKALERLRQNGLYSDDTVQSPPEGMFYPADRKTTHWRDGYAYWHYHVRAPDSPLTTLQVAILSFLWHLRQNRPGFRLSISFLALLLCAKRDSISSGLQVLESEGLLTYSTSKKKRAGLKVQLRQLLAEDMRHFQDMANESAPDRITVVADVPHADLAVTLKGELDRLCSTEEVAAKLARKIMGSPNWPTRQGEILTYCRRCPAGSQGFYELMEALKMGLAG